MHTKHPFISGKADGTDATLVKPSNWNADHVMTTDADGIVLGRTAGAGAGAVQELPFSAVLPYGIVVPFAGVTAPTGWLICDGSSLLRSSYPGLFTAIGVTYGAVDGAHFNIPDGRGRVIAGMDPTGTRLTGATISPDGNTLGGAGGAQTETSYADVSVSGTVTVSGSVSGTLSGGYAGGELADAAGNSIGRFLTSLSTINTGGTLSGSMNGGNTLSGGGATRSVTNVQPTLLMNWIIKT